MKTKASIILSLICISFTLYVVSAILTAPDITSIKECMKTSIHNIDLCQTSPNYVSLDEISKEALQAFLVSEDINFYHHPGFDFEEIKESIKRNILRMKFSRGGSTISQQLVKNVFLSNKKSIYRKIQEAYLTTKLEKTLKKDLILEKYFNVIELGNHIFGIKQASQHYFQKTPSQLNFLEAAYLAHLLPSPKKYSNSFEKGTLTDFNRSQVLRICKKLLVFNKITEEEYTFAEETIDSFPWQGILYTKPERDMGDNLVGEDDSENEEDSPSDEESEILNNDPSRHTTDSPISEENSEGEEDAPIEEEVGT